MFEQLTGRLINVLRHFQGISRFTEANIESPLKEIRTALLEADVALPAVKTFSTTLKEQLLGKTIDTHLSPAQATLKFVQKTLTDILGAERSTLQFNVQPPAVLLLAGLQGSGKTTTAAKLAYYLHTKEHKKVILASADIYRPAAIEQLQILAQQCHLPFVEVPPNTAPDKIAQLALDTAKKQYADVLIMDTAGRLHIDDVMMTEIKMLHQYLNPIETLFVVDSMTGQDAANTAKAFHDTLPLTGIILTKTDGDARGGAALSVKTITGKPIKFIGTGEKIQALEPFYPERAASLILGMGDLFSLIEDIEDKVHQPTQATFNKKLRKGQSFDLEDFKSQLLQMNQMGGLDHLAQKLPGMSTLPFNPIQAKLGHQFTKQAIAIINAMTPQERQQPKIILGSRKKRIAFGAGLHIQDVNRLLKQFEQIQKMMQKFMKPGALKNFMRGLGDLKHVLPSTGLFRPPYKKE